MTDNEIGELFQLLIKRLEDLETTVIKMNNTRLRHNEEINLLKANRHCAFTAVKDKTGMYDGLYTKDDEEDK